MKKLSFTQADMESILQEFKQNLLNFKSNQDKFVYEKKFSEVTDQEKTKIKKPVIYFAMEAWIKMLTLVHHCEKEIAWQATVEKRKFKNKEDSEDFFYYIKQVFVYPQKVTGTFVDVDQVKYAEWSLKLEDEVYNSLRFQGHSHVNMSVGPSGTDLNTYQNFLEQLDKNDFYIFMIINKKSEFNIMVYDYAQNILFENKDCFVDIITPQGSLNRWTEENMKLIEFKQETRSYGGYSEKDWGYDSDPWPNYKPPIKPQNQGTPMKAEITYINFAGYMKNKEWHRFENTEDALDWFIANPEYIDQATLSPAQKELILQFLESEEQPKKKKGRPPKGEKKK